MLVGRDIQLRRWDRKDAALLADWLNDPEYWGPFYNVWPSTESDWEAVLAKDVDINQRASFVVRALDDDRPLGTIGYFTPTTNPNLFRALEIWYQVHPSERGRGVATKAAGILVNHLFSALPIERIQATVVDANAPSCAVLERIGMQREGLLRHLTYLRGSYADMIIYSILRENWRSEEDYAKRLDFLVVPDRHFSS